MFDIPTAIHEFCGEPIKQFRVKGQVSLTAKLFAGPHNANAKKGFPQTIHLHSCGERIVTIHEPFSHREPILGGVFRQGMENSRCGFFHFITERLPVAAKLYFRDSALLGIKITHDRHGDRFDGSKFLVRSRKALALRSGFLGHVSHIVVGDELLLVCCAFGRCESRNDIRGCFSRLLHAGITADAEAEVAECVPLVLALLVQRDP